MTTSHISDDPDAALELAKSISQTEAEEAEAARKVHDTHARIVNKYSKPATSKTKLNGAPSLTPQEQEAADIMQAHKESKKTSRKQLGTEVLNEGTGSKPGDITKEKVILEWGDKQDSQFSDDDNDDVKKDDKDGDADDECDDRVSDTQDADDEDVKTESDEDEIYKYKIRVRNEEDVEMKDAEVEESDKGEEKVCDLNSLKFLLIFRVSTVKDSKDEICKIGKDVSELKTVDHSFKALAVLQSQVLIVVDTLIEDENAMDKGVADTVKDHKRKHDDDKDDDDKDPPDGPNQGKKTKRRRTKDSESSMKPSTTKETPNGKAPTKGSKVGKSASAKEPIEEPIAEVVMDDVGDDVARDDYQPQDTSEPKARKTLNT
ncbi:hypothetical protein Tco_0206585 [Tanacetum coccineum]